MPQDVGWTNRLYQMMLALMTNYAGEDVEWPSGSKRGIVTEDDALHAVMHVAAVVDEALQERLLDRDRAMACGAALMVLRDYVRPLPVASSPGGNDTVGNDLREMVTTLRAGIEAAASCGCGTASGAR
jgi:hypothetical protein